MLCTKIVGFRYFDYVDRETKTITKKVTISFLDPDAIADVGQMYLTYSFKADNVPKLDIDALKKDVIVDIGNFQGRKYGSSVMFR